MLSFSSYFSVQYILFFFPVVLGLYAVFPQKIRRIVLLLASFSFFWAVSGKLIVFLLFSILGIHHAGLWIASLQKDCDHLLETAKKEEKKQIKAYYQKKQRAAVAFCAAVQIGILLTLKYTPFFSVNINTLLRMLHLPQVAVPSFALPIGISFYTMQAVSYIFDVYRRKIPADRSIMRLALFMSFFPQLMEGPICRYSDTAHRLWEAPKLQFQNVSFGLQRILFGIMKKVVIADRLNLFIKTVFSGYADFDGLTIAVAAVCYTIQLYMDFSGTMDLVIGTAQIFGIRLPENFRRPFFSRTISEFWQRWHITLGAWFKDYIFYPISMSKPLKKLSSRARRRVGNHYGPLASGAIALFCVWIANGLWHGAGWHYIFFGMYHFALILAGNIFEPATAKLTKCLHIRKTHILWRCFQIIRTALLVCIGELFFRAHGLRAGLAMFQKIITDFSPDSLHIRTLFTLGMDKHDFLIVAAGMLIIFIVSLLQENHIAVREQIARRSLIIRFAACYALIMFIIIFGAYGSGYIPVDPIYAAF